MPDGNPRAAIYQSLGIQIPVRSYFVDTVTLIHIIEKKK